MNPKTAAVICTWNKREDLLECLASVTRMRGPAIDIVVVDNASGDGTAEAVKSRFPAVTLIVNPRNLGGAGGFNTGLRRLLTNPAYGRAWLLDNDVVVDADALAGLQAELDRDPRVAIAGSLILRRDAPATLQELGARLSMETFEREPLFKDHPLTAIAMESRDVDYVPACSLLVDLAKVRQVGCMDDGYFLYYDDVEWCTRMKRAGYRVVATPASRVWHREGGRNRTSNLPVYYAWRNAFHFFMATVAGTPAMEPFLQVFLKRAFVALYLTRQLGKPHSCQTILAAMWDAILGRRGCAPASRNMPLDPGTAQLQRSRIGSQPVFFCPELDFYTALPPLLGEAVAGRKRPEFFTAVAAQRLPDWLRERVSLRPQEEALQAPAGTSWVVLCRHVVSAPHPLETRWQKELQAKGRAVCFFDQHSNAVWGRSRLNRLRKSLASEWQWFLSWMAPLLAERMAGERGENGHG